MFLQAIWQSVSMYQSGRSKGIWSAYPLLGEYFPDCPIEKIDDRICRIYIDVPAKERLWKALLLSFGSRVKVIGPDDYREELIVTAQDFLSNYNM